MKISQLTQNIVLSLAVISVMTIGSVNTFAQTDPGSPSLPGVLVPGTTATAASSSTPDHKLSIKACRYTFDWATYIADRRAGVTNSNPYISQGCVEDDEVTKNGAVVKTNYNQFARGNKTVFGNDPVLGVFPNAGKPAQNNSTFTNTGAVATAGTSIDRSKLPTLITANQIFTATQLDRIFSTTPAAQRTTKVTGVPRIYSTGPDQFSGSVYQGGWCMVENGEIKVRMSRAGQPLSESFLASQNRSSTTPTTSCARTVNGTRLPSIEDRPLRVYQAIYEYTYPTASQCMEWFGVDATTCNTFFNNRYARDLAGDNSGTSRRTLSVYTFYGSFDDQYSQWVGWTNPDVNGPRKSSTDAFVKSYDGFSVYSMSN